MDLQFKNVANSAESNDVENEYHLEVKIESLELTRHQPNQIELIFMFGDLVNKMRAEEEKPIEGSVKEYIVHSVPAALSEKLLDMPIVITAISLEDKKPLGEFKVIKRI